jgi:hypothetical protein
VTDAGLVTVIIGVATSLILIVIGSLKEEDRALTDGQNIGHDIVGGESGRFSTHVTAPVEFVDRGCAAASPSRIP